MHPDKHQMSQFKSQFKIESTKSKSERSQLIKTINVPFPQSFLS